MDDLFDCIVCYHALEHIEDERKALCDLYRVLKPGGRAVIQVPIQHLEETVGRSEWAGFRVEIVDFVRRFSADEIKRLGLDPTEDLYL